MNALINTDIYNKRGLQHLSIFSDICAKGIWEPAEKECIMMMKKKQNYNWGMCSDSLHSRWVQEYTSADGSLWLEKYYAQTKG